VLRFQKIEKDASVDLCAQPQREAGGQPRLHLAPGSAVLPRKFARTQSSGIEQAIVFPSASINEAFQQA